MVKSNLRRRGGRIGETMLGGAKISAVSAAIERGWLWRRISRGITRNDGVAWHGG